MEYNAGPFIDACGMVCYANRQVSTLLGYAQDEIIGQNIEPLMPERFRSCYVGPSKLYEQRTRAAHGRRPGSARTASGCTAFPIEIRLSPLPDGERVDGTDRRIVEAAPLKARQVAEQARETADRANLAKSRFLATASHDLRQPPQTRALLNGTMRRLISDAELLEANSQ